MRDEMPITALLGPTNTGKTHYAIERMLAHRTGVIGLPLRLLAREVYDRITALRGPLAVALITGEERIVPPKPRYWVATVEAMPVDIAPDFLAVDEIQLCADPERGHIFTDRLLHARGLRETLFLGSDAMRGVIADLVPRVRFESRPRLSELSYTGRKKLSRIPPRAAIVGFSVDQIYAIAELLRRQKGGVAVVMGALSPRTRNAQVELYQNGEVDYLVATDAIGMGLNLDITHVAFSSLTKFDGWRMRPLFPHELAQIAGRAGRHLTPGSFGVTGEAPDLLPEVEEAITNHRFRPVERIEWRNRDLNFASPERLIESLEASPSHARFMKSREADDLKTLKLLAPQRSIATVADTKLLWSCCQIPDFRNISEAEHAQLAGQIFDFLRQSGKIPQNWLHERVTSLDREDGNIDTLSKRLAYIRSWTYISQRSGWLDDQEAWRARTREVEDRLSDALHRALTHAFVDRRSSHLMRRLKQKERLVAEVNDKGEVMIEGEYAGRFSGFRFQPDQAQAQSEDKALRAASLAALKPHYVLSADRFYNTPDTEIDITDQGGIMWGDAAIAKLVKGHDILSPKIEIFVDEEAGADVAQKIERRVMHYIDRKITALFEPLLAMQKDETLSGMARGVAFQLIEALGVIPRQEIAADVKALDQDARGQLRKHGVRFGQFTLFMPALLKPAPTRLRILLWSLFTGLEEFPETPPAGLVTIPALSDAPEGYYARAGYRAAGARAIRIDMLERLADLIRAENSRAGFEASADMLSITGTTLAQFAELMQGLGYSVEEGTREKPKAVKPAATPEAETVEAETVEAGPGKEPEPEAPQTEAPESAPIAEATEAPTASEPEMVTFYRFSWAPRPARPATSRRDKPEGQNRRQKGKPKGGGKGKSAPHSASPAPKKEKPIDPDNPFAALMALKSKT